MKDEGGRLKGYGYADLADRDSLVNVLTMELSVKNRKMRIDLASQAGKDRPERGFNDDFRDRRGGGGRNDDPDAGRSDADDWRRGPPPPAREENRYNERDRSGLQRRFFEDFEGGLCNESIYLVGNLNQSSITLASTTCTLRVNN